MLKNLPNNKFCIYGDDYDPNFHTSQESTVMILHSKSYILSMDYSGLRGWEGERVRGWEGEREGSLSFLPASTPWQAVGGETCCDQVIILCELLPLPCTHRSVCELMGSLGKATVRILSGNPAARMLVKLRNKCNCYDFLYIKQRAFYCILLLLI